MSRSPQQQGRDFEKELAATLGTVPQKGSGTKTCTRCGIDKPLDGFHKMKRGVMGRKSECAVCSNEREKLRRQNNPEVVKQSQRRWHNDNPGYYSNYRRRNPPSESQRESARVRSRNWRSENRERHQQQTLERYYDRDQETIDYDLILRGDPCSYCGGLCEHVDHIDPRDRGGSNLWDNLTASCGDCNRRKHTRNLLEWLVAKLNKPVLISNVN